MIASPLDQEAAAVQRKNAATTGSDHSALAVDLRTQVEIAGKLDPRGSGQKGMVPSQKIQRLIMVGNEQRMKSMTTLVGLTTELIGIKNLDVVAHQKKAAGEIQNIFQDLQVTVEMLTMQATMAGDLVAILEVDHIRALVEAKAEVTPDHHHDHGLPRDTGVLDHAKTSRFLPSIIYNKIRSS